MNTTVVAVNFAVMIAVMSMVTRSISFLQYMPVLYSLVRLFSLFAIFVIVIMIIALIAKTIIVSSLLSL